MKDKVSTYMPPLRDVPLALFYGAIWYIALWVVDYPVYETLGVVIFAYVTLWTSRLIVSSVIISLLDRALRKMYHVANILGIEIPEPPSGVSVRERITAGAALSIGAVILSIAGVTLGASFALLIPAVAMMELTPLGVGFSVAAFALLAGGLLIIVPYLALTFARLARYETLSNALANNKISECSAETLSNTLANNEISKGVSHIMRAEQLLTQWRLAA